jgi:hypothetical protein
MTDEGLIIGTFTVKAPEFSSFAANGTFEIDRLKWSIPFPLQFSRQIAYKSLCVTGSDLFSIRSHALALTPPNFVALALFCDQYLHRESSVSG